MHQLVYISEATAPISEAALVEYLRHFGANNERKQVTGLLLYSQREQRFMQLIEGEQRAIAQLFDKIEHDQRHHSILKLADGPIAGRTFPCWLMGFPVLSAASFTQLAGYLNPGEVTFQHALARTQDASVRDLLSSFITEHALVRLP